MRIVFYVVAGCVACWGLISLFFAALTLPSLSARPDLSEIVRSGFLTGGLALALAACIIFLASRYGARPERVVEPSRNETWFTAMRVAFYVVAVALILLAANLLAGLLMVLLLQKNALVAWIGPVAAGLALSFGLGIYFFLLAGRCKKESDRDVRPYIRQGGFVLLGLAVALAGVLIWSAMPYFMGESCSMALLLLVCGAPVVLLMCAVGVTALIVARR